MRNREEDLLNIQFIDDESISSDMFLWRYMDLHKFLSFISSESLFFTRLDKFEDKREGITDKHLYFKRIKDILDNDPIFDNIRQYITVDTLGGKMNMISDELAIIQRFNFANCWLLSDGFYESAAMWNLYSSPNSVAIKIPYSEFKRLLLKYGFDNNAFGREIKCSPIKYKNFQKTNHIFNSGQEELENSIFQKDISFEHEKEYRIVINEKPYKIPPIEYYENVTNSHSEKLHNSRHNYPGISLKLANFEEYPFQIVHHPKSEEWAKKNIEDIIKKFNISFSLVESKLELK